MEPLGGVHDEFIKPVRAASVAGERGQQQFAPEAAAVPVAPALREAPGSGSPGSVPGCFRVSQPDRKTRSVVR
jgi:hypothetical protein